MTKREEKARALYDALADSVIEASEKEIADESRESGESPEQVAAHMRQLLRRTWTEFRQRPLKEARQTYLRAASLVEKTKPELPSTPEARRQLLVGILAKHRESEQLMAQFRDFEEMTDEDVQSWLEHFGHLGLLPPPNEQKE
jgi:hypothetical protein